MHTWGILLCHRRYVISAEPQHHN